MVEPESARHLFQRPRYRAGASWHAGYRAAIPHGTLTWDTAAVLSVMSFGYACGNRTLLQEVTRQPWLTRIDDNGDIQFVDVPGHGLKWATPDAIAMELLRRLEDELVVACAGRDKIYLLLSGGLDSRIVAGVVARLLDQGRICAVPTAVTWGAEDSRDVLYAQAVAERLKFGWRHIPFEPAHLLQNIDLVATKLGALVAPTHLHRMAWFENVERDALVIAGSYGDSVGRGEFSGSSVLELRPLQPLNIRGLLRPDLAVAAAAGVQDDLDQLKRRTPGVPAYAFLEIEQQGQYMRGMIAHVMSVINEWCTLYQAFTAPEVYGYMWNLHPAARTDEVYVELIRKLGNDLIAVPWARTNRPIDKAMRPVVWYRNAVPDYRPYQGWMADELREEVHAALDPAWFSDTDLFDRNAVNGLRRAVTSLGLDAKQTAYSPCHVAAWLWSFRHFTESVLLCRPKLPEGKGTDTAARGAAVSPPESDERSAVRRRLADVRPLLKVVRHGRKWWLRRDALKRYPPE